MIIIMIMMIYYVSIYHTLLNIYLAGGRREPRVVRVEGGRGERMESQSAL